MVRAYILIEMAAGHARNLVDSREGQPGGGGVARVTGPYDVIAVLEAEDVEKISDTLSEMVHPREGVLRPTTCVSIG